MNQIPSEHEWLLAESKAVEIKERILNTFLESTNSIDMVKAEVLIPVTENINMVFQIDVPYKDMDEDNGALLEYFYTNICPEDGEKYFQENGHYQRPEIIIPEDFNINSVPASFDEFDNAEIDFGDEPFNESKDTSTSIGVFWYNDDEETFYRHKVKLSEIINDNDTSFECKEQYNDVWKKKDKDYEYYPRGEVSYHKPYGNQASGKFIISLDSCINDPEFHDDILKLFDIDKGICEFRNGDQLQCHNCKNDDNLNEDSLNEEINFNDEYLIEATVPKETMEHISTGTWKDGILRSGAHSNKAFMDLKNRGFFDDADVITCQNGVRIVTMKDHPHAERKTQIHTFFPEKDWGENKIRQAIKKIWNDDNLPKTISEEFYQKVGIVNNVRVVVGFEEDIPTQAYPSKDQKITKKEGSK